MIDSTMTLISHRFFAFVLTATASSFALAQADTSYSAQSPNFSASQSLPGLTPQQIAADVEARFDPLTGRTEYIAQNFDPFESDNSIAGSALLRSASTGISRDGANIAGGAYLDVSVMYSSASRDPYDAKGLEHAVFMNGEPVNVMSYDVQTLDCARDITRITYDSGYYRGDNYGYVGGIYRHFPRYRGHDHYYSYRDRIRYGSWRGLRHNYYGYNGYFNDRYYADRRSRHRDRDRHYDRDRHDGNDDRVVRDDRRDGDVRSGPVLRTPTPLGVVTSRNVIRADMLGDTRLSVTPPSRVDPSLPIKKGPVIRRMVPIKDVAGRPAATRTPSRVPITRSRDARVTSSQSSPIRSAPVRSAPVRRTRSRSPIISHDQQNDRRLEVTPSRNTGPTCRRNSVRSALRAEPRQQSRPVVNAPTRNITTQNVTNRSEPRRAEPRRTETRRKEPKRPDKTRASRNNSSESNRSNRSRSNNNRSRAMTARKSRSVNQAFKSKKSIRPAMKYYPAGHTETYVDQRCVKEERLSLHIPADRLHAARFDGLSIAILDWEGGDIPVYIPPNYIEGFTRANPYLQRSSIGDAGQPYDGSYNRGYPQTGR